MQISKGFSTFQILDTTSIRMRRNAWPVDCGLNPVRVLFHSASNEDAGPTGLGPSLCLLQDENRSLTFEARNSLPMYTCSIIDRQSLEAGIHGLGPEAGSQAGAGNCRLLR